MKHLREGFLKVLPFLLESVKREESLARRGVQGFLLKKSVALRKN